MQDFTDFEPLHKHLEENASEYKYSLQIGNLFQKLRDLKHKEDKPDDVEKAQWEVDIFNFVLRDGEIKAMYSGTDDKGEPFEYPNLNRFNDKTYDYLIVRLNNTSNPILLSRYAHILWCSPKKHQEYAKKAIDSYLDLISIYEEKDKKEPSNHYGADIKVIAKNAYYIAKQINYRLDDIIKEIDRLIKEFRFDSSFSFALRMDLMRLLLDKKTKLNLDGYQTICWQLHERLINEDNIHAAIDILEMGEKIDLKMSQETYSWRKKIAEYYEFLMNQAEEKQELSATSFCREAIKNYKIIKDENKVAQLEKKCSELKTSGKYSKVKTEIDLTDYMEQCKTIAQEIAHKDSEEIIKILMISKELFPKYNDLKKLANEQKGQFIHRSVPSQIVDRNGHPAQLFSDEEELEYLAVLQMFDFEMKVYKRHLIREILLTAIRENKLSTDILLKFFNQYSWFGKSISKKIYSDETIKYNWLHLIAPSINEFFIQMQYLLDSDNYPNLILCIDSLTLKFEGLIRDICHFNGVTTFYMQQDNKGRNIAREKDIHALLYEEPVKKLFDEDDLLFFKFLLVEKAGYNLRHKIAHSLMFFSDYDIDNINYLVLALLRLGKYDFVEKETQDKQS